MEEMHWLQRLQDNDARRRDNTPKNHLHSDWFGYKKAWIPTAACCTKWFVQIRYSLRGPRRRAEYQPIDLLQAVCQLSAHINNQSNQRTSLGHAALFPYLSRRGSPVCIDRLPSSSTELVRVWGLPFVLWELPPASRCLLLMLAFRMQSGGREKVANSIHQLCQDRLAFLLKQNPQPGYLLRYRRWCFQASGIGLGYW